MRQYVVQPGDSPAGIASRPDMAGCPKCAVDLIAANPSKATVKYPNGFVTFKELRVGEILNLPDKWFNGALDQMPQSYFENLPAPPPLPQRSAYFPMQAHAKGWAGLAASSSGPAGRPPETEFQPDFGVGGPSVLNPCDQYSFTLTGGAGSTSPNFGSWPTLSGPGGTGGPSCFGSNCNGVFTGLASVSVPTLFPDSNPGNPPWVVSNLQTTAAQPGVVPQSTPPCAAASQSSGQQGQPCQSSNDCTWGLTCQGGTCQPESSTPPAQAPTYTIPPGATFTMLLLPGLLVGGGFPGVDATAIVKAKGLTVTHAQVQSDCSVMIAGSNAGSSSVSFSNLMVSAKGDAWVNYLVINSMVVVPKLISMQALVNGTLTHCHKFGMTFKFGDCTGCPDPARSNVCRDPTAALKAAGFTSYTLLPSPDRNGNITMIGTWEGATRSFAGSIGAIHVTDFKDLGVNAACSGAANMHNNLPCPTGQVKNAQGVCVTSTGGAQQGSGVQAPAASNTGTYVAIGAGVLLVGGGIALAMSSKKKRRR